MENRAYLEYLERLIDEGEKIRQMLASGGWKIVEEWIKTSIASGIEYLLICNPDELIPRQTQIRTLKSILQKTREYMEIARQAEKELSLKRSDSID